MSVPSEHEPAPIRSENEQGDDLGPAVADKIYPSAGKRFDPAKSREWARGTLAISSFALFAIEIVALTLAVICGWRTWDELEGVVTALIPVTATVVASATGFYFASTEDRK